MLKLPSISGKNLISYLQKIDFVVVRIKGSHHFLKHMDGRVTVVPVHANEDLGPGILSKILKDCNLTKEEFYNLIK